MNNITKKLIKSLLVTSALSLLHSTAANAQELKHGSLESQDNDDNVDEIQSLKRNIVKKVVKVSPTGRMTMVNDHTSHSSHRSHSSHYSGSSGGGYRSHSSHQSHSSHYSSSGSSYSGSREYSSSSTGGGSISTFVSSKPKAKTVADYSLGDRTISSGTYGADVNTLAELLVNNLYIKQSALAKKSGYYICDAAMVAAIKHFQRDAGFTATGTVDQNIAITLQTWSPSKTSVTLGIRDITVNTTGQDVNQLITLLNKAGYSPDQTKLEYSNGNAVFTVDVQIAVKMFQAYNGLRVTGNPDAATLAKLKGGK